MVINNQQNKILKTLNAAQEVATSSIGGLEQRMITKEMIVQILTPAETE